MHTKILGTGSYLPVQVRSNQDLEKMVETQDYSNLEALLNNNEHTDIDSVIALGYEEKGCNYADMDYLEELPQAISKRLQAVIGDF